MSTTEPDITYVDENDVVIGSGPRSEAGKKGIIHRVVRILVFNDQGLLLIQKRAPTIAIANRWDDSAAGHVDAGEDYLAAAVRELSEEVGITNVDLKEIAHYYSEDTDDGLTKKRYNKIYRCIFNGEVRWDPQEVSEVKWVSLEDLLGRMQLRPSDFTAGFRHSLEQYTKVAPNN